MQPGPRSAGLSIVWALLNYCSRRITRQETRSLGERGKEEKPEGLISTKTQTESRNERFG